MRNIATFAVLVLVLNGIAGMAQDKSNQSSAANGVGDGVKYFSKNNVDASFAGGFGTLVSESNYKVMTAHRTEDGNVEIHNSYTDVFYIVQGSTDIVTGGKVSGVKNTNPDEPRGDSIEGGKTQHLSAGDVLVIPPSVPHWMRNVQGTLLYFVVKVKKEGT